MYISIVCTQRIYVISSINYFEVLYTNNNTLMFTDENSIIANQEYFTLLVNF